MRALLLRKLVGAATAVLLAATSAAACDGDSGAAIEETPIGRPHVGVILPDVTSDRRWQEQDPANFTKAFAAADIPVDIRNARGDTKEFERIGKSMLDGGAKVLIITNLDSRSGKAVIDRAHTKGVPVIDYDRLTANGGADYHVSFDYEQIGRMQAYGLAKCLSQRKVANPIVAELNGSPADYNATLMQRGHDAVLQSQYDSAQYTKGPSQFVPDWNATAARGVFTQMLIQQPGIDGVLAANDEFADLAIAILRVLDKAGRVPVAGQDATLEGLQNMLTGDQCMTVYKRIEPEAQTAANIAAKLFRGQQPELRAEIKDPESGARVPFAGLVPRPVTVNEIKDVVADGHISADTLCAGSYRILCRRYRVIP